MLVGVELEGLGDDLGLLGQIGHHAVVGVDAGVAGGDLAALGAGGAGAHGGRGFGALGDGGAGGGGEGDVGFGVRQGEGASAGTAAVGAGGAGGGAFLRGSRGDGDVPETGILGQFLVGIVVLLLEVLEGFPVGLPRLLPAEGRAGVDGGQGGAAGGGGRGRGQVGGGSQGGGGSRAMGLGGRTPGAEAGAAAVLVGDLQGGIGGPRGFGGGGGQVARGGRGRLGLEPRGGRPGDATAAAGGRGVGILDVGGDIVAEADVFEIGDVGEDAVRAGELIGRTKGGGFGRLGGGETGGGVGRGAEGGHVVVVCFRPRGRGTSDVIRDTTEPTTESQ